MTGACANKKISPRGVAILFKVCKCTSKMFLAQSMSLKGYLPGVLYKNEKNWNQFIYRQSLLHWNIKYGGRPVNPSDIQECMATSKQVSRGFSNIKWA